MSSDSPLLAAVQFLTRLPVPSETTARARAEAPRWYALVGGLVGGVGAAVQLAATERLPVLAPALGVLATVALTGALHEDGLADTADAYGFEPRRAREILKDPRLGTHGVVALCASLALRIGAAASLVGAQVALAYVTAGVLGRAAAVVVMCALPYAFDDGARRTGDAAQARFRHLVPAVVLVAALAWGSIRLGLSGAFAVACGAASLVVVGAIRALRRWLSGTTGDTLGAVVLAVEIAVYLVFAAGGRS